MDYEELFKKYQELLIDNNSLRDENRRLKIQLGIINEPEVASVKISETTTVSTMNQKSDSNEKIKLFISLFKGREDVYAKRWQNREGRSG